MGVVDEGDALTLLRKPAGLSMARKVLPLPAPPRTSTRFRRRTASRMTAWCSVSASAASSLARARATTSRCGNPLPLNAVVSWRMPSAVSRGRSISWRMRMRWSLCTSLAKC
jgi:hypothetical protein